MLILFLKKDLQLTYSYCYSFLLLVNKSYLNMLYLGFIWEYFSKKMRNCKLKQYYSNKTETWSEMDSNRFCIIINLHL